MSGLRLIIYDDTCRGRGRRPDLTHAWLCGARLYRLLGWADRSHGARNWGEALRFLATTHPGRPIAEVQFWGHGKWGGARIGSEQLSRRALHRDHPRHADLIRVRDRMAGPGALWWFRTCETFGAEVGRRFAREWGEFLGCRVAGHTRIIGFFQSGLHCLVPGREPDWPSEEGLLEGTAARPIRAATSGPRLPGTVTALHPRLPESHRFPRVPSLPRDR